jgi:co-chaperonin GroES (HSP10)
MVALHFLYLNKMTNLIEDVRVLNNNVLVSVTQPTDVMTKAGVYIPENSKETMINARFRVVAIGPDCFNVRVGDYVIFNKNRPSCLIQYKGEDCVTLPEPAIEAVIKFEELDKKLKEAVNEVADSITADIELATKYYANVGSVASINFDGDTKTVTLKPSTVRSYATQNITPYDEDESDS